MNPLALKLNPSKIFIEITQGPEKGSTYEVFASDIRIGREDTNDIILVDSKCSREHAIITTQNSSYYIEDLKSQNGTLVNGQKITKTLLKAGSEIQIGNTILKFKVVTETLNTKNNLNTHFSIPTTNNTSNGLEKLISNKKIRFYLILLSLGLFFAFLLSGPTTPKIESEKSTSDEEIIASQKRQELIIKNQNSEGLASRQYLDAQASYMKGLRDYREGYYKSAFVSFNAAIAIYPDHKLARRYLRLAQNKFDEQVQVLMNEGNNAMDENKYQLAQSSFKNVLVLINDPENKIYKEAQEKLNECNLLLRGAF